MTDDIIQQTINAETERIIKKEFKKIQHKKELQNAKMNKRRKQRKQERINRKKGRK